MEELFSTEKTKLIKKYPTIFKNINDLDFSCEDGWISLLDELCNALMVMLESLPKEIDEEFYVTQIKEKFGMLRFYTSISHEILDYLIYCAEKRSAYTCEFCGSSGKIREHGWLKARCDKCEEEHLERLKNLRCDF